MLLAEDKDFGELVDNRAQTSAGVILVRRFARLSPQAKSAAVLEAVVRLDREMAAKFVVVEPVTFEPAGSRTGG